MTLYHATCVALHGRGIAIRGASGAGKSALALRLIHEGGAVLVADDQTRVEASAGEAVASPPEILRGRIEAHGVGILSLPFAETARLAVVVDVAARDAIERLPEPDTVRLEGVELPRVSLDAADPAAVSKLCLAVTGRISDLEHDPIRKDR